ncbi:MAG: hypothetical protein ACLTAK_01335 [Bacilli bacterium]
MKKDLYTEILEFLYEVTLNENKQLKNDNELILSMYKQRLKMERG